MQNGRFIWFIIRLIIKLFGVSGLIAAFFMLSVISVLIIVGGSFIATSEAMCEPSGSPEEFRWTQAKTAKNPIPANYRDLYVKAAEKWNIPWYILAGIGYVESRHGTSNAEGVHDGENSMHAAGPMQFIPSTWEMVNPGVSKDRRYNPHDAIFSAAKLLKMHIVGAGASDAELKKKTLNQSEIRQTLYSYNHSSKYVNAVLAKAKQYAADYDVTSANYAGTGLCSGPLIAGSGSFGQQIAYEAAYYAKWEPDTPRPPKQKDDGQPPPPGQTDTSTPTPYSWGGGTLEGPDLGIEQGSHTVGFDCSALARYAVYQASDKQIKLYGNTYTLWALKKGVKRISREKLAPGDLVFFNNVAHMGIYYGRVNGVRWMVEAWKTGTYIKFSKFDQKKGFVGALRVIPPPGMESQSPVPDRAIAPAWADARVGVM